MANDLSDEHAHALGIVLRRFSVVKRFRCERVSKGWQKAVAFSWKEQWKLDRDIVFKGASEENQRKFWENAHFYLISLIRRFGKNLRELDLQSFGPQREFGDPLVPFCWQIAESLQYCEKLHKLDIGGDAFDLEDFVDHLPTKKSGEKKPLRVLLFSGCLSVQTLRTLSERCPNLEEVPFYRVVEGLSLEVLNEFIGKFPSQKRLTLLRLNSTTITAILKLEKLEALEIWDHLNDDSFRRIVPGCRGLRKLNFNTEQLTEESLFRLAEMPNLVDLEVRASDHSTNTAFTDAVLREIAKQGKLKRFVYALSKLTDDGILYLIDKCKELVTLALFNPCTHPPGITERSLEAVVTEVRRRYGNPPFALPRGPLDPGIFYFPIIEANYSPRPTYGKCDDHPLAWSEEAFDMYGVENPVLIKQRLDSYNPWLVYVENGQLLERKLY